MVQNLDDRYFGYLMIPDLGGIAEEDSSFADEVQQPVLTYPGAYRRVTVELKVHHLAVNALLKSNLVDEMDGGALLGFDHDIPMSKLHDPALRRILHKDV
ncbi:DNA polymerase epsilon catalytic subunit A [Acorus gramineus]|uniref:DNA polymerase epsilon catalytic subunit n=1 Tax=Acorus gramineus TaxID=55184 RepID=A0AAV9A8B7_ACOGR|nr:DNA polymerase epsilon catalytic subunit A [Acorus gramineus]